MNKQIIITVISLFVTVFCTGCTGKAKVEKFNSVDTLRIDSLSVDSINDTIQDKQNGTINDSTVLILVDSIQNKNYSLEIETKIKCIDSIYISPATHKLKHKNRTAWVYMDYCDFFTVQQVVKFKKNNRIIKQLSGRSMYNVFCQKVKHWDDLDSVIENIYIYEGKKNDLYLIHYIMAYNDKESICCNATRALYDMQGRLLWFELVSKNAPYKSGDYNRFLKRAGIKRDAIEDPLYLYHGKVKYLDVIQ